MSLEPELKTVSVRFGNEEIVVVIDRHGIIRAGDGIGSLWAGKPFSEMVTYLEQRDPNRRRYIGGSAPFFGNGTNLAYI